MLISCPNCKTTFAVPAKYIGATGRKLKCSKCAHVWMQGPIDFSGKEKLNSLLKVEATEKPLPVVIRKVKFRSSYIFMILLFAVISILLQVLKEPKQHVIFADKIALTDFEGLRFHDFKVDSEIVDNKMDFYLKGTIINITDKKIRLPLINVKAYSHGGRVMAENKIALEQKYIEPFAKINIAPEVTRISGNAETLELSFENWIEGLLR